MQKKDETTGAIMGIEMRRNCTKVKLDTKGRGTDNVKVDMNEEGRHSADCIQLAQYSGQ
jgi:hypothetical protein